MISKIYIHVIAIFQALVSVFEVGIYLHTIGPK